MKPFIIIVVFTLFAREVLKMFWAIETNAKPIRIIVPCISACVLTVFAKCIGKLLAMI